MLDVRLSVVKLLKDGAVAKDVYNEAASMLQERGLGDAFVKNIGFAVSLCARASTDSQTGLEYRDSTFLLGPKNERKLKENMILIVTLGLADLSDKKGKYSLMLQDTVKVGVDGGAFLTEGCTRLHDVVMELDDEDDEPAPVKEKKPSSKSSNGKVAKAPAASTRGASTKQTRGAQREQIESTTAQRIKVHQAELHAQRKADGLKKWANGGTGKGNDNDKVIKRYESYRREEQLPPNLQDRRVS